MEIECPFCGVTKSGRVWRKVPESDTGSVTHPSTLIFNGIEVWTKPGLPMERKKYGQTIHINFADYASGMLMLKRPTNSCGFPSAVNLMAASPDFSVASVVGKQILLFLSIFETILLFVCFCFQFSKHDIMICFCFTVFESCCQV